MRVKLLNFIAVICCVGLFLVFLFQFCYFHEVYTDVVVQQLISYFRISIIQFDLKSIESDNKLGNSTVKKCFLFLV